MGARYGMSSTRDPVLRRAKIRQAMDMIMRKGVSAQDTAHLMNVTRKTVDNWRREAKATGIIDEIREKMETEQLPKALRVYDQILDADVDDLTSKKTIKAHDLKFRVAKSMMEGIGVLKKHSSKAEVKANLDLEGYYQLREARRLVKPVEGAGGWTPPTITVEAVPPGGESSDPYAEAEDEANESRDLPAHDDSSSQLDLFGDSPKDTP